VTVLRVLLFVFVTTVTTVSRADDAIPVVVLSDEIVVSDPEVRWIDLARGPLDSDFGRTVVFTAPAPGRERTWTRRQILREAVRRGLPVVPQLTGRDAVRVVRRGGRVPPDALSRSVRALLVRQPLPPGGLDQEFEVLRVPRVDLAGGLARIELDGELPRVGRGAVAIRIHGHDGSERRAYTMVERTVLVPVLRTRRAVDARTAITVNQAVVDSLWTDDVALFDRRLESFDLDGRHSLLRRVPGGRVLRENDVRPTPVVHRGELVHWVVERDGLRIQVTARARNDGAVGEWISVLSPFDQRQRRVVVIAPGVVADHLPLDGPRGES